MKSPDKWRAIGLGVLACLLAASAWAQAPALPKPTGHINDFANVVDAPTRQRLETMLTNFEALTGAQIAVAVVPSLNERPIEDYANELYRAWGLGAKSGDNKDKGALLVLAIQDRKTRLEVGYGLEGDLPDGLAGELIRRMRPALQQGAYSQAVEIGVRSLVDTLAEKWNVSLAGIDRRYAYRKGAAPSRSGGGIGLPVLVLLFLLFLWIASRAARRGGPPGGGGGGSSLWWLAPILLNRGGGGFGGSSSDSGGGSGGDSGGGNDWGGFDGGSSGGGGASDNW